MNVSDTLGYAVGLNKESTLRIVGPMLWSVLHHLGSETLTN